MKERLSKKQLGAHGESAAAAYLRQQGYIVLDRNWRCRSGEIDIVAADGELLVFVEVRTRSSTGFGTPAESVDYRKQRQVMETAQVYLMHKKEHERQIRFDVVSVMSDTMGNVSAIDHIRSAF